MTLAMGIPLEFRTVRLLLRRWVAADRATFASLNADPRVMEHFPAVLEPEESHALVDRIERHFDEHGFGLWAVEIPGVVPFAGFVGLLTVKFQAHFTPCVEVGWRLAAEHWGHEDGRQAPCDDVYYCGGEVYARHFGADENKPAGDGQVYSARPPRETRVRSRRPSRR
jgi:hypothetical protein